MAPERLEPETTRNYNMCSSRGLLNRTVLELLLFTKQFSYELRAHVNAFEPYSE